MGLGKRAKAEARKVQAESETDAVEGILHIGLHAGYHGVDKPKFVAMDKILREQLEKVVGEPDAFDRESCAEYEDNPEATLKKALSTNMTWEAIEKEFMQSEFWKRQGDPVAIRATFNAHDSNPTLLRLTNFWKSRKDILDEQLEESHKFIPKAKTWFEGFVTDPDISDYLEIDMEKVWNEISNVDGVVQGPDGKPMDRERDAHGILEKSFLDIGIVRLPDFEKPHVKVFRLKLTVWNQMSKKLIVGSGIRGDLRTCKYCPRDEHMKAIQTALKRVKTEGAWRVEAKGNTKAVRIMSGYAER